MRKNDCAGAIKGVWTPMECFMVSLLEKMIVMATFDEDDEGDRVPRFDPRGCCPRQT
jgi:hypothetical protein